MMRYAVAAAAILAASPGYAQGTATAQGPARAEVIHWWTSGGESAALRVYADAFTRANGQWVDTAIAGGANARTAAVNRVVGGDPPTAMQFNTGKQFDDLVENDLLENVDALAQREKWAATMPAAIVQAVTRDGHAYAVPVDIHGQNWLFFSTAALAKAGAEAPTTWDDVFPVLDKLRAAGIIPLGFSGQKVWERNLFSAVLAGVGGADGYVSFWGKRDAAFVKGPVFRKVAETYRRLRAYVDSGSPGRNWNDATAMVIQGRAGMQVMGDWAKGEFTAAGQTAGKDYGCTVLSARGTTYAIGGDVFAFPRIKSADAARAQALLAQVMTDPANQVAFSAKKGSVPARMDADVSALDECARKAHGWLLDPSAQVAASELLAPPAITGAMEDLFSQYWNDASMTPDAFIAKVAAALSQP
jgi:glucose/mannose transport system substrate-binding protein